MKKCAAAGAFFFALLNCRKLLSCSWFCRFTAGYSKKSFYTEGKTDLSGLCQKTAQIILQDDFDAQKAVDAALDNLQAGRITLVSPAEKPAFVSTGVHTF